MGETMRSRNIKPGFFKNEQLAELPFEARILFAGLWCLADKEGRLQDRPKRIGVEVFPYEEVNADILLDGLRRQGLIVRYTVNETPYIQIVNFSKHQNPHHKEVPSVIPPPGSKPKLGSSSKQARPKHESSKAPLAPLIPDSLIPDSHIPDSPSLTPDSKDISAGAGNSKRRKANGEATVPYWQEMVSHINDSWKAKKGAPYPFDGKDWKPLKAKASAYGAWGIMALWDKYLEGKTFWGPKKGYSLGGFFEDIPVLVDDPKWRQMANEYRDKLEPVVGDVGALIAGLGKAMV